MGRVIILDLLKVSKHIKSEKIIFASSPRYQLGEDGGDEDCDILELACVGESIDELSNNILKSLNHPSDNFHPNSVKFNFPEYRIGKILKPLRGLMTRQGFSPCEKTHIKENFKKEGFKN